MIGGMPLPRVAACDRHELQVEIVDAELVDERAHLREFFGTPGTEGFEVGQPLY